MRPNSMTIEAQRTSPFKGLKSRPLTKGKQEKKKKRGGGCAQKESDGGMRMAARGKQGERRREKTGAAVILQRQHQPNIVPCKAALQSNTEILSQTHKLTGGRRSYREHKRKREGGGEGVGVGGGG